MTEMKLMGLMTVTGLRSLIATFLLSVSFIVAPVEFTHAAVGADGIPILWDTAWILPLADQATIDDYLTTRAQQGFDGILVGFSDWGMENSSLGNGQRLFL